MSDSDMDIDDDEVQVQTKHTVAGESHLLHTSITQNGEHSKTIKESCFENSDNHKESRTPGLRTMEYVLPAGNSQPSISRNIGKNIELEDGKVTTFSRFPAPSGNEPEQKRAALLCKFFAKGCCFKGTSCRFLHVKENSNITTQQQAENNMVGSSFSQFPEETSDSKEGVRVSQLNDNGKTSLHARQDISFVNPPGSQRVFPSPEELNFMSLYGNIGRQSLKQKFGADVTENRSLVINNSSPFTLRSSFVHEHTSSMESSGPAWAGSLVSSVPRNEYGSSFGHFENGNSIYGSGSLPTLQGISVSSDQDAEANTTSSSTKKVYSNDWEPSEPFQASFTIPPYILPSSDALYDPFTETDNVEDISLDPPLSSTGKHAQKNSYHLKDGDSASGPQARECNSDDKNSSCSQNQHQEIVARKNLEAHVVVEGVATSVVDQNDTTTPSKEISSPMVAEDRGVIKRGKPVGHDSWHRSDGSSYKKMKSDELDGEVRSDAGMKVMRQFRTAVVDTIKEMLKPLWREGRLSKDVHNMIVKKSAEKVVSSAVQLHQLPTETESVEQYLSLSAPKIVKLVEGYVERYGKP